MSKVRRRVGYVFLCILPFLLFVVFGVRNLRIPGVFQAVGAVLFVAVAIAAWTLGARTLRSGPPEKRGIALAGALFVVPWWLMSLLWIGIGPPFQAGAEENQMRFLLLLSNSIVVMAAFIALKEAVAAAGERICSTLGVSASIAAGMGYFVCMSIINASYVVRLRDGAAPDIGVLSDVFDVAEFFACVMTYVATAAFATALGKVGWLGRRASHTYAIVCAVCVTLLVMRGLSYPEISTGSGPWYSNITFIVGIPAIPWIMPFLMGVVLLRRAGDA